MRTAELDAQSFLFNQGGAGLPKHPQHLSALDSQHCSEHIRLRHMIHHSSPSQRVHLPQGEICLDDERPGALTRPRGGAGT